MVRVIAWIFFLGVFAVTVILTAPNAHSVVLNYYLGSLEISLAILLFLSLSLGALIGISFNLLWVWRLRRDNRQLQKLYRQALTKSQAKQDTPT
ncbi:MAG: hypothetical protein BWK79_16535 [Beggiatoa sp. IS2]|nr:MAG: hypothetical protein BWK79_16535 [Beggiatoa sp. IS2]